MKNRGLLIGILFLSAMVYAQEPVIPGGDITPTVVIESLQYKLNEATHTAMVANTNTWVGELDIPEQVAYNGETYTVDRIEWLAFDFCNTLTKVRIPKTVVDIQHYAGYDDCKNPFRNCANLVSIEVDEANPSMCSIDGVLFNKDKTRLYCYPAGAKRENYSVPDGVTWLGGDAFAYNPYLLSVQMPNSVTYMSFSTFSNCKSLNSIRLSKNIKYISAFTFEKCDNLRFLDIPESVSGFAESVFRWSPIKTIVIRGTFPEGLRSDTFYFMDDEVVIYVQPSEIDKFKKVFKGTVLSLKDWIQDDYHPFLKEGKTWNYQEYYHNLWDDEQWTKDISYVINGTTEIDGKTYYKMYRTTEEGSNYFCALREEDRKVWQYTADGDHLLYDFGMSVGDSYMPSYEPLHYLLTAIKPMRFHDNQLLNVLYYDLLREEGPTNPPCHIASAPIVEGVGCEGGWNIMELYAPIPSNGILQGEDFLSCYEDGECIFTADDFNELKNPNPANNIAYRPFVEEGKVWKVGTVSGNPVQVVDYYYFDGDTIIDGKTCKQMMCQRFISPDYPDDNNLSQSPALRKVGAWYEEDKKVYFYDESKQAMRMMYDFSLNTDDPVYFIDGDYSIGPKQAGGLEGFKGVYRNIWIYRDVHSTYWLEGVGGINGPTINAYDPIYSDPVPQFLMSCAVGDEVIYLNDDYEDGATPEGARKHRFDFTHTIKTQPKAPMMRAAEQSLYGEYNEQQLGINLNPLDNAYLVRITDESGKVVYEKTVNTGIIVGLNIDISAYTKGRYAVSVENSHEIFTGEFEAQTTGIEDYAETGNIKNESIYNLQGQRVSSLQKGLMIVNGKKVHVK